MTGTASDRWKSEIGFVELMNVRIYDLVKVDDRNVRDMVLIVSDEGGMVLDRLTGELYDMPAKRYDVAGLLFERDGRLAVITGIGRNRDGSGTVPGESSIEVGNKTLKIVFALERLCIATIHLASRSAR